MVRLVALLVMLALLAPGPAVASHEGSGGAAGGAAGGGGGAFGPLPPATPAETPTPEPQDLNPDDDVSRETMFLVAAAVILLFGGLGWAITRDARRSLTESDRAELEGTRVPGAAPRKQDLAKIKQKARQKTRAQKRARKKTRR